MLKDTKSLGNNKAPACESRGFVLKKKKVRILTHLLSIHLLTLFYLTSMSSNTRLAYSAPKGTSIPVFIRILPATTLSCK